MITRRILCAHGVIVATLLCGSFATTRAANFVVDTSVDGADATPGDGVCATSDGACTVRAAIEEANGLSGADTITVPAGRYRIEQGELSVQSNVTVNGAGANKTVLDALNRSRVLRNSGDLVVTGLRIQHGSVVDGCGGGIYSDGTLALTDAVVTRNRTIGVEDTPSGGGICNFGQATVTNGRVLYNRAIGGDWWDGDGGGIFNGSPTANVSMTLNNTEVSYNRCTGAGGYFTLGAGISNYGALNVNGVRLSGNRALASTVVRNMGESGSDGGGIYNQGDIAGSELVLHANISWSETDVASGGGLSTYGNTASVVLANVVVDHNRAIARNFQAYGGGIESSDSTVQLTGVRVTFNRVVGSDFVRGGGIDSIGNMTVSMGLISHNLLKGLSQFADSCGGGVSATGTDALDNLAISFNHVVGAGATDGGVCGMPTMTDVTFANNAP